MCNRPRALLRSLVMMVFAGVLACVATAAQAAYVPHEGDVVFQTSRSAQSRLIQQATHSRYSHMGIVLKVDGRPMVLEAVQPVKYTSLATWIARGEGGRFVVRRPATALKPAQVQQLHREATRYLGKPYDARFGWSNERIYCSELVWKLYHAIGIDLAPLTRLRDFDLDAPDVRREMTRRYGTRLPLDEPVIAPSQLYDSPRMRTVDTD